MEAFSLCVKLGLPLNPWFYDTALHAKRENFVIFLDEIGCHFLPSVLESVVASGSRSMVERFLKKGLKPSSESFRLAMQSKDSKYIKWLIQRGFTPDIEILAEALSRGNLSAVKLLHEEYGVPLDPKACWSNFDVSNTRTVEYLIRKGLKVDELLAFQRLVKQPGRNIHVLFFLVDHGMQLTPEMSILAAKSWDLPILKFLRSNGVPFDISSLVRAVSPFYVPNPYFQLTDPSPPEGRGRAVLCTRQLAILKWLKEIEKSSVPRE